MTPRVTTTGRDSFTAKRPQSEARREVWRPVLGYEGRYEVSDHGSVRNAQTKHILRPVICRSGYESVALYLEGGWKTPKRRKVHNLVCEAWHGPRPGKYQAAHLDGNSLNNTPDNLAWVSAKENCRHKILHGTACRGERVSNAILTNDMAAQIWLSELTEQPMARMLNVTKYVVADVRMGRSWRHITEHLGPQPFRGNQGRQLPIDPKVQALIADGHSDRSIGRMLGVSFSTVGKWRRIHNAGAKP